MRQNWLAAYDFASERGALFLSEYARAADPFAEVGRHTVSVQVTSIVRASDSSFRVNWTENAFERGSYIATSRWTAIITIRIEPPRSAEILRKNPLGLYVDAIDWSREFETLASEPAPTFPTTPEQPVPSRVPVSPPIEVPPTANIPLGSPLDPQLAPTQPSRSEPEGEKP